MDSLSKLIHFVRGIRIRNWKVVLLCVLAAATFKLFNSLNKDYTTSIQYPVNFEFDGRELVLMSDLPEGVQLNVSGDGWTLFRRTFGFNVQPLSIALERPVETKKLVASSLMPLLTEQVKDLKLNFVVTDTLHFDIEPEMEKAFVIRVDSARIQLEENYRIVSEVSISSDTVLLKGPTSLMTELPDTLQLQIPEEDIDENYNQRVELSLPIEDKGLIDKFPSTFEVLFDVEEHEFVKTLLRLKKVNFPKDSTLALDDSVASIVFWVNKDKRDEVKEDDFELLIDYHRMDPADSMVGITISKAPEYSIDPQIDSSDRKIKIKYLRKGQ